MAYIRRQTLTGANRLGSIADKMQELKAAMDGLPDGAWNDTENGAGAKLNIEWRALYCEASRSPVQTQADLVGLARVSKHIRDSIGTDTNAEIEHIGRNIDAAILSGVLLAVSAPDPDAAIFAACEAVQQLKIERDACPSDNDGGMTPSTSWSVNSIASCWLW